MRRFLPIVFFGLVLLGGCDKRPEGVLSEDKMVDLMTDIQLADAYYHASGPSSERIDKSILTESVLKKHGVSHAELDSTLSYYGKNMDEYYKLYEKVEKNLRARNNSGMEGDSYDEANDLWPYSRFAALLSNQLSNGITFSIPAEGITPGNSIEWGMRLSQADGVEITLGAEYEDGSASLMKKTPGSSRNPSVTLQTDTALQLKRIFGTLTLSRNSLPLWADSIRLVKTDYDSLTYSNMRNQKFVGKPVRKPVVSRIEEMEGPVVADTVNR